MKYKIIGVFVLLSVLFISAPKVKAYTLDDLMAQIATLQQQVSSLQSAVVLKAADSADVSVSVVPAGCQILYWTDNNNKTCASSKQFCGAYMYQGLNTFANQAECQESLSATTTGATDRGIKVTLEQNPGGACKTSSTGQCIPTPTSATPTIPGTSIGAALSRGIKVVLVENPGGACKTSPKGSQCSLTIGTKADEVKSFQIVLQNAGYLPTSSAVDGNFGPKMKAAVIEYQEAVGLPATGIIDPTTASALGSLIIQQSQVKPANIKPINIPVGMYVVTNDGGSCGVWSGSSNNSMNYIGSGSSVYDQSGVFMGCLMGQTVYHSS